MKEKILNAIKAKIGKTDISEKTLNAYVAVIEGQITDEAQIETAIGPSVIALKEIQANINSVAAQAAKAKQTELETSLAEKEKAKKAEEEAAKNADKSDDTPAWAKTLIESNKTLTERLAHIEGEKTQQTLSQKLAEKVKDIPDFYKTPIINGRTFKDDSEVETFAESITTGWASAKQSLANQGFQESKAPEIGVPAPADEVSQIVSQINAGTQAIINEQKK